MKITSIFTSRFRAGLMLLAAVGTLTACQPKAQAQSASLSGSQIRLFSGLITPVSVALDSKGDIFLAPQYSGPIEITPAGVVSAVNTPAHVPGQIKVDAAGDVFVTDQANNAVYETSASGAVTTVVSSSAGLSDPDGLAVDSSGNVFVGDLGHSRVVEFPAGGGPMVTVIGSHVFACGLAVDAAGDLFVADLDTGSILKVPAGGGSATRVASGFAYPLGVAVDAAGDLFVADENNHRAVEVPAGGGPYITLASGLNTPSDVAVDSAGNVYIADFSTSGLLKVEPGAVNFGSVNVCPTGRATPAPCSQTATLNFRFSTGGQLGAPAVLTQGAAGLDFTDAGTGSCTTNGTSHSYSAGDTCTVDVIFTPKFSGERYGAVELLDSSGGILATTYVNGAGTGPQVAYGPGVQSSLNLGVNGGCLAEDAAGNLYICDNTSHRIVKETLTAGGYIQSTVANLVASAVAADGAGNLYIAVFSPSEVVKETLAGGSYTQSTIGSGLSRPSGIAVDAAGNVYIGDSNNNRVLKETISGATYIQSLVAGGLSRPFGIGVDASGDVFVADVGTFRVLKETPSASGTYAQSVIDGNIFAPYALTVDGNGNVFASDQSNNIFEYSVAGGAYTRSTVESLPSYAQGLAVDGVGNLYSVSPNYTVTWKLDLADVPSLSFPNTNVGSSSTPQSVTLENIGNAPLNFPTPGAGYNPSIAANFTYDNSSTCEQLSPSSAPTALAAGSSCTLAIAFAPTVPGSVSGSAVASDNNLNVTNATQSISLNGTATQTLVSFGVTGLVNAVANTGQNLKITAYDADGNVDTAYNGTVRVSTSDPNAGIGSLTVSIASGQRTVNDVLKLVTAGSQTVTVTDTATSIAGTSAPVTISAASANKIAVVQGDAQSATVNTAFSTPLQVLVTDQYSNPVSGVTVTFIVPANGASATLSTATATGADGTTSVTATANATSGTYIVRAGVPNVNQVNFHLTNNAVSQTITFASLPASVVYGSGPISLSATASSNLTVTFSVLSGPATLNGTTLTITGVGQVVVAADQTGNSTYAAAKEVTQTIQVTAAAPTISFSVGNQSYGAAPFVVAATSNSAGAITYSVVSGPATINGSTVTLTGVGTVVLQASQAANGNYAAGSQNATFTVSAAGPTISFTVGNQTYGVAPFTVAATSNSPGAITYSVVSGPATINGSTVTLTGAGMVVLQASQAANGNYSAGIKIATFTVTAPLTAVTLQVAATTVVYPLPPIFEVSIALNGKVAPAGSVQILDGSTVLGTYPVLAIFNGHVFGIVLPPLNVGQHVLTAVYSGDKNYPSGSSATVTVTVVPGPVKLGLNCGSSTKLQYGQSLNCTVSANEAILPVSGTVTYTVTGATGGSLTLNQLGQASIQVNQLSRGSHTLTVSYAAQGNYQAAAPVSVTITVR